MSKKHSSENKQNSAYGTHVPTYGQDQPESAAEPGAVTAHPGVYGTQPAPPVASPATAPQKRVLPPEKSLRHLSQTQRADGSQLSKVLQVAKTQTQTVAKPESEGFATPDETPRPQSHSKAVGKSTWHLRIKQRAVAGYISGVINSIPDDPATATGLQSAFTADDSVSEYEVISELGSGSMGIVYRARQTSLNRELAIKTLKPDSPNVEHDQEMFVSEAVVTANLVHPNIIPIHDLGRTSEGKLFYSMKQVTGTSWNDTIRKLSLEENLDIFMKVCNAVAYAHSRGVINRDLKPENVVVGDFGEVIVLDWGLAITTDKFAMQDSVVVEFRGGAGTPVYMPPELADEDVSGVGDHSDIYLLGAILFEILEGFPPHLLRQTWDMEDPDEQLNSVIWAVLNNEIEPNVTNEGELMQIARTAMSTHPGDRYSSVKQLEEAIREYRITGRAEELMQKVELKGTTSYSEYQSAVALYEEALRKWPNNRRALDGDRKARLAYAELAHRKGDIDLGLQVIPDDEDRRFRSVRSKLNRTRRTRKIVRGTWTLLFVAAISLSFWVVYQNQRILNADQSVASAEADAAIAKEEADKERAAAATAIADAETAKSVAEAQTKIAQREKAAAATAESDKITALAEKDSAIAAKNTADADRLTAVAEKMSAIIEAKKQSKLAMAAESALISAQEKEQAALQKAKEADDLAREAKTLADFDILVEGTNAKLEIGNYDAVIQLADRAVALSEQNDFIRTKKKNEINAMQKKRKVAMDHLSGNTSFQRGGAVELARFSRDGSTLVTFTRGDVDGEVTVERELGDLKQDSGPGHHLKFSEAAIDDMAVSADGNVVCAIGHTFKHAWVWNGDKYLELDFPEGPDLSLHRCLVSRDGSHLYLLSSGRDNILQVFELTGTDARLLVPQQLADDLKGVEDVVLLPDESALLVALASGNCRSIGLQWTADGVVVAEAVKGVATDVVFPRLMGLENLGEGGQGDRFEPQQLSLSVDGSLLALFEGSRVIAVPRLNPAPGSDRFPYTSPKDIRGFVGIKCGFNGRIAASGFSHDNSRLVTAQDRYLQLWQREGGRFQICRIEGLYEDEFLAGHAAAIRAVAFLGPSNSRVVSVAADHTIRFWNTETYGQYVQQLAHRAPQVGRSMAAANVQGSIFRSLRAQDVMAAAQKFAAPRTRLRGSLSRRKQLSATMDVPAATVQRRGVAASAGVANGRSRYILTGAPQPPEKAMQFRQARKIYSAEFSRDSERIVVGADDLAAHSFNSRTAEKTVSASMLYPRDPFFAPERNNFLEGHIPEIVSLRFLPPQGDLLLTFDYFGSISVWDAKDDADGIGFEKSRPLPNEPVVDLSDEKPYEGEDPSCEVAVSADGRWIAAGGVRNDGSENLEGSVDEYFAVVWKTDDLLKSATPPPYRVLKNEHPFRVTAVAFSQDGNTLITAGRRGRFVLWDFENSKVLATAEDGHGSDGVSGVFFSSANEFISSGFDGRILRWSIEGDQLNRTEILRPDETPIPDFVIRLRPSPDGTGFITSDLTKAPKGTAYRLELNYWLSESGWKQTLPVSISAPADDLAKPYRHDISWSQDGSEVMYVHDEDIRFLDSETWKFKSALRLPQNAIRGAIAPGANGETRIATFDGRFAHMWNPKTGEHLAQFRSHGPVVRAGFSADRKFVATASESIRIFNSDEAHPDHGRPVFRLPNNVAGRTTFADARFRPVESDYHFATIDVSGVVKLWDWTPGGPPPSEPIFESEVPPGNGSVFDRPSAICWSQDGNLLAAIQSGKLRMWQFVDGQLKDADVRYPDGTDTAQIVFNAVSFSATDAMLTAGGVQRNKSFGLVWKISDNVAEPVAVVGADDRHSSTTRSEANLRGITAIAFDHTQNEIITGGADSRLVRWQLPEVFGQVEPLDFIVEKEGRSVDGFSDPHRVSITSLEVARNGRIVSADEAGWIVIWPASR